MTRLIETALAVSFIVWIVVTRPLVWAAERSVGRG